MGPRVISLVCSPSNALWGRTSHCPLTLLLLRFLCVHILRASLSPMGQLPRMCTHSHRHVYAATERCDYSPVGPTRAIFYPASTSDITAAWNSCLSMYLGRACAAWAAKASRLLLDQNHLGCVYTGCSHISNHRPTVRQHGRSRPRNIVDWMGGKLLGCGCCRWMR